MENPAGRWSDQKDEMYWEDWETTEKAEEMIKDNWGRQWGDWRHELERQTEKESQKRVKNGR